MIQLALLALLRVAPISAADDDFLRWSAKEAKSHALAMRVTGRVGGSLDGRIINTDRAINYKLRATWLTPEVIRASVRLQQLSRALSNEVARKLVAEAESVGRIIIQVEIDPREGSGVIPKDWVALLSPETATRTTRGVSRAELREVQGLAGGVPRDYAYDIFWVVFSTTTEAGRPLFSQGDTTAELTVRITNKIGRVRWPLPSYLR